MIRFHALGVRFTLPLLTLIFPVLAAQLHIDAGMGALLLALGAHELAHVLAAAGLGVQITEIRLMPFGGSARMENPYGVPAGRLACVAAAGPGCNLLLALLFSSLAQWGLLSPAAASGHIRHNLVLCIFNLLPALPLDGGRMLYCLLQRPLGQEKALKAGILLGRILAICLIIAALLGGLRGRKWNLSFLLAAVFLLSAARDERNALLQARAQRLCLQQNHDPQPVRIYQAGELRVGDALALLRPRERTWFALPGGRMIEDQCILDHIMQNGAADLPLGDLPGAESAAPIFGVRN